jgi:hypothetical protein
MNDAKSLLCYFPSPIFHPHFHIRNTSPCLRSGAAVGGKRAIPILNEPGERRRSDGLLSGRLCRSAGLPFSRSRGRSRVRAGEGRERRPPSGILEPSPEDTPLAEPRFNSRRRTCRETYSNRPIGNGRARAVFVRVAHTVTRRVRGADRVFRPDGPHRRPNAVTPERKPL